MSVSRLLLLAIALAYTVPVDARQWTDQSGQYSISADVVAYSDQTVVLRKLNSDLVAVPIENLSDADQQFLHRFAAASEKANEPSQAWKLKSGLTLTGRVVGYCIHDVVIESRLGNVYVNSRRYDRMPGVYRTIIPKIVQHFTEKEIEGEQGLKEWIRGLKGEPRTFECSGVMIELDDDDLYCVPFFLFTDQVVEMLRPGWERWLEAKKDYEQKERESFLAHAQAEAYQRQRQQAKQIQQLQLNLQAYDVGLFDLWEVEMYPPPGQYGMPLSVVVPAVDSVQAAAAAKQKNPSYRVGAMRVVRSRD